MWGALRRHVARAEARVAARRRAAPRTFQPAREERAQPPAAERPAEGTVPERGEAETEYRPGTLPHNPAETWDLTRRVFREYSEGHGTLMAASVAFYLLLSLIPLVLVGLSLLGYLLGSTRAESSLFAFVSGFMSGQEEVIRGAIDRVREARGAIGGIGLVSLLFTATGGFATLESAINIQWETRNRNVVWAKVFSFLMLLLVGVLFILSFGITEAVSWAGRVPALRWLAQSRLLQGVGWVLPIGISALMFAFMYRLFPNVPVSWRSALVSGGITALLWELFKIGYTLYSRRIDQSLTYGTLGGFVGLILWIYYSGALILLGSELTRLLEGCPSAPPLPKKQP